MKIKLLALDMDGTTLKSDHVTVSPANRAAIEAANARGVFVVTATGRMRHRLPEAIEQTPGLHYAVTCNGASVFDLRREAPLYANPIPMDTALRVFDTLAPFPSLSKSTAAASTTSNGAASPISKPPAFPRAG